jgi:hypothetical protein
MPTCRLNAAITVRSLIAMSNSTRGAVFSGGKASYRGITNDQRVPSLRRRREKRMNEPESGDTSRRSDRSSGAGWSLIEVCRNPTTGCHWVRVSSSCNSSLPRSGVHRFLPASKRYSNRRATLPTTCARTCCFPGVSVGRNGRRVVFSYGLVGF